ncbi:MAG: 30S ribosomal protein S1 [Deltaproteobacteria bacterium]|nr:MAG: 30S ribosomal protein S1 [Deltaproteobacteria bacterium]
MTDVGNVTDQTSNLSAVEDEDFASLLMEREAEESKIKEGAIVQGTIISKTKDKVIVDIGFKSEGHIDIKEFAAVDGTVTVNSGDVVDVLVEMLEDSEGTCRLSKEKADKLKIWEDISQACEADQVVEGTIVARVKGGLSVDIGVKAFLPGSQVDLRPVRNLDKLIGQTYKFKVIKFNKKRNNIVLSRRALLEEERATLKKDTLDRLKEGELMEGVIKNITDYGAFVDLGGIDGLLHITDMSWGRINHPSERFKVGDEITVKVLKFDANTERVSLGLKQITEDPWTHAASKYPPNTRISGRVVSLTDYGAFVEIEEGIEGLVHISEMSWTKRIKHPSKVVSVNDEVEAMVLDLDVDNRRISLGMKQVEPNPWTLLREKYPLNSKIVGNIRNITDFGIFVGIEEGIDGLVHISDISWTHRVKHPSEIFELGQEVEAVVTNIDEDNQRFSLSIKELTPDPWEERIPERYRPGSVWPGVVKKLTDFGAFVELEKGIEGLVHVSEISDDHIKNPRDVLDDGQEVAVKVISLDPDKRQIGLSIRSADDDTSSYMMDGQEASTNLGALFSAQLAGVAEDVDASSDDDAPKAESAE